MRKPTDEIKINTTPKNQPNNLLILNLTGFLLKESDKITPNIPNEDNANKALLAKLPQSLQS